MCEISLFTNIKKDQKVNQWGAGFTSWRHIPPGGTAPH